MAVSSDDLALLDQLAEDFVIRLRRGERPPLRGYVERHPDLAREIERLFPTLVTMEKIGSSTDSIIPTRRPVLPERIGEYRIVRQIGEGGMGVVYEAVQESLGRHVALKVLPAHARSSERFRERFRRESRAAARLQHPNIVPVFGVGECEGIHFYAMQFISGRGLDVMLRSAHSPANRGQETVTLNLDSRTQVTRVETSAPVAPPTFEATSSYFRRCASIVRHAAEALDYAHREGVIHRDIKPSNLILDDQGSIWVTDFGLAKTSEGDGLTEPGDIVGTIRYMAPERFNGWADARSDVYGLGATLYELLTRRSMYADEDRAKLIQAILHADPVKPRKCNRAIPRELETIVLKATAREPGHRYQSAEAMAADLQRFEEGRPILASRQTLTSHAWSWCRRKPVAAGMAFSLAVLLGVLLIGSLVVNVWMTERNERIASGQHALGQQLKEIEAARLRESEANAAARHQLMNALRREADAARLSKRPGGRADALAAIAKIAELAKEFPLSPEQKLELRNVTIASLALMDIQPEDEESMVLPGSHFSPDHQHYITIDGQAGVRVREYSTGKLVAERPTTDAVDAVTYSPDSRWIVYREPIRSGNRGHRLVAWDWRKDVVGLDRTGWFPGSCWSFRHDSAEFALLQNAGVEFFSVPGFRRMSSAPFGTDTRSDILIYHPAGDRVAALGSDSRRVQVRDARTGTVRQVFRVPDGVIQGFSWSADGRFFGIGCSNYRGYVFHAENGQLASDLFGHHAEVTRVVFDPNGFWVATSGWDNTTRFWNPATGTLLLNLPGIVSTVSADGSRVVCSKDHQVQLMDVTQPGEFRSLHGHTGGKGPWHVGFSANSRLMTSCSDDGVRLWDARTGKALGSLPAGPSLTSLFHPSGKLAVTVGSQWIYRWPIEFREQENLFRIGPKEVMCQHQLDRPTERRASMSADGARLAISNQVRRMIYVFPTEEPELWRSLGPMHDLAGATLSPDGNWIVGYSWPSALGRIWDARTSVLVKEIPLSKHSSFAFSPDSRKLVSASALGAEVWEVGTWKKIAAIPSDGNGPWTGSPAFSPDGRILAVGRKTGLEIQLLDAESLTEIAKLQSPDPQPMYQMTFSPDGARLASTSATRAVRLWDIQKVRAALKELDLDWDGPDLPSEAKPKYPLRAEVASN